MSPITHFLVGWMVANLSALSRRERAVVALAGVAPDLDGLGLLAELATRESDRPLLWWTNYHHVLAHNLAAALAASMLAYALASNRRKTALLVFLSFHLHLLGDLAGSRGPDGYPWPIPYFAPLSDLELTWSGQWALNAWPNVLITLLCLAATLSLAWRRGYSPIGLLSLRADAALVEALRRRFPPRAP